MITSNDLVLLDTNVLVYAADKLSPFHNQSREFRDRGQKGEIAICVTPQVLFEFYAVITDPRRVNQPLNSLEAVKEINIYLKHPKIKKIYQGPDIVERVTALLEKYKITRQKIFDALIVATMISNDIKKICTYDTDQFSRFDEIEVLTP